MAKSVQEVIDLLSRIPAHERALPLVPTERQEDDCFAIAGVSVETNPTREQGLDRGDHVACIPAGARFVRLSLTR